MFFGCFSCCWCACVRACVRACFEVVAFSTHTPGKKQYSWRVRFLLLCLTCRSTNYPFLSVKQILKDDAYFTRLLRHTGTTKEGSEREWCAGVKTSDRFGTSSEREGGGRDRVGQTDRQTERQTHTESKDSTVLYRS